MSRYNCIRKSKIKGNYEKKKTEILDKKKSKKKHYKKRNIEKNVKQTTKQDLEEQTH